jgi:hypothetical protein
MKTLIAVISCRARPLHREAIRDTWFTLVPKDKADVKFFVGRGEPLGPDTVVLDCDDSYQGLPDKVRSIAKWARDNHYSHMLKCDDDVVLDPEHLLSSGYENYDFVGHRNSSHENPIPPYGFCYWLSSRSINIVADADLPRDNFDEGWVRTQLYKEGITLHHDSRYFLHFGRKEDFVPKRRPPRAPVRSEVPVITPAEGTFAWCLYIPWLGYKNLPVEREIQEFKKVFETNVSIRRHTTQ